MRLTICLTAALALCACSKQAAAPAANDGGDATANAATAEMNATASTTPAALTTINETSWEFTDLKSKKTDLESIDASGKYITQEKDGGKHVDHGTAVMKDGKACFTSAMDKEGEVCWTDPKVAVGESGETTSDKGDKLTVKRVAYTPLAMPK